LPLAVGSAIAALRIVVIKILLAATGITFAGS
jgi:hypothetical protein